MQLDNEAHNLERIAKAFRLISEEISHRCMAKVVFGVATMLLSEGGELLAKICCPPKTAQIIATRPAKSSHGVSPSGDFEMERILIDIIEPKAAEQMFTNGCTDLARTARVALVGELNGSVVSYARPPLSEIIASAKARIRWLGRVRANPHHTGNSGFSISRKASSIHGARI